MLNEKSSSKSQQRLMGMVYSYKNGKLDLDDLPKGLADKIKNIADGTKRKTGDRRKKTKGIDIESAKDFASTKHEGLPENIKENIIKKFDDFIHENNDSVLNDNNLNDNEFYEIFEDIRKSEEYNNFRKHYNKEIKEFISDNGGRFAMIPSLSDSMLLSVIDMFKKLNYNISKKTTNI